MMIVCKLDHLKVIVAATFVLHATGIACSATRLSKCDLRDLAHAIVGIDHDPACSGDVDQGK